jgi:hypothetical protein
MEIPCSIDSDLAPYQLTAGVLEFARSAGKFQLGNSEQNIRSIQRAPFAVQCHMVQTHCDHSMTREKQYTAIISSLQAVDFMSAMLLIHDPSVFELQQSVVTYDKSVTWLVSGHTTTINHTTVHRSALMSGAIAMRALVNMLGLQVTRPEKDSPPRLVGCKTKSASSGNDLQWQHIPDARGLTTEMLGSDAAKSFRVRRERDLSLGLDDVLRIALRAAATSVAHLVHEGAETETLHGDLILASAFTCIAVQELVLIPSWGKDYADKVFENTRALLPVPLAIPHRQFVDTLRSDLSEVFQQV